jgi:nicotinamidase-related amidase
LKYLGTRHLVMTGIAGDVCVLISAIDAYMRDFRLHVPADCIASPDVQENEKVLAYMERVLHADLTASDQVDLQRLVLE